jgi:hypothetical protein
VIKLDIKIDDELRLLKGSSFFVDGIEIKPFKIGEIVEIGYVKYQQLMNVFALEVEDIIKDVPEEFNDVTIFDLFLEIPELYDLFINGINLLFNPKNLQVIKNENIIFIDEKILNRNNWMQISNIVKLQNCFKKEEKYNPADPRTAELLRKRDEARRKVAKAKGSDGDSLNFADLVSVLSANGNGIDIFNVWDLTFYSFNNQFARMKMLEDYDISIRSLLAGAKSEDVDLKHWMSKI